MGLFFNQNVPVLCHYANNLVVMWIANHPYRISAKEPISQHKRISKKVVIIPAKSGSLTTRPNRKETKTISARKADAQKRATQIYQEMMARYLGESNVNIEEITVELLVSRFEQSKKSRTEEITLRACRTKLRLLLEFIKANFSEIDSIRKIKQPYLRGALTIPFERRQSTKNF